MSYFSRPFLAIYTIVTHQQLLKQLLIRSISLRYKGSMLGIFWTITQPLLMLFVYSFVFGLIFQPKWAETDSIGMQSYPIFIFSGLSILTAVSFIMVAPGSQAAVCVGAACSVTPSARTTLRIVSYRGFAPGDSAL